MNTKTTLIAALTAGALGTAASAAHVDFFDAGDFDLTATDGQAAFATQDVPPGETGALGGQRAVSIFNPGDNTGAINVNLTTDSPDVNDDAVNLDFGGDGFVTFEYGGFTDAGDLNADFLNIPDTDLNWTRVEADFALSSGGGTATVTLTSDGASAALSRDIPAGTSDLGFDYVDFLTIDPNLDLESIDSASLVIEGDLGDNYSVSFFHRAGATDQVPNPIPTPGAAVAGLALLGGVVARRRRNADA